MTEAVHKAAEYLQQVETSKSSVDAALQETKALLDASIQARNKIDTAQAEAEQFSKSATELVSKVTADQANTSRLATEVATVAAAAQADKEKLGPILEGELTDPKIFSANDLKLLADTFKQLK